MNQTDKQITDGAPRLDFPGPGLVGVATLVLWTACLTVGVAGLALGYSRTMAPVPEPPPVQAQLLQVELATDPAPPASPSPSPSRPGLEPPPLTAPPELPPAPPALLVVEPSPLISFAVPTAAPARVVPAREATFRAAELVPAVAAAPAILAPERLTFGTGEGRQPAPEYPRQALREGQQGTVLVRFIVGENGRVLSAEAAAASAWPLLNEAALRVIRQRWRFAAGTLRTFEVTIHFQLKQ